MMIDVQSLCLKLFGFDLSNRVLPQFKIFSETLGCIIICRRTVGNWTLGHLTINEVLQAHRFTRHRPLLTAHQLPKVIVIWRADGSLYTGNGKSTPQIS